MIFFNLVSSFAPFILSPSPGYDCVSIVLSALCTCFVVHADFIYTQTK